jgi:hypothetical protein
MRDQSRVLPDRFPVASNTLEHIRNKLAHWPEVAQTQKRSSLEIKRMRLQLRIGPDWAAAGFKDTLLRWKMKLEVADGHEKEIQPRVQA